jgi:DNA-binding response OmpR family regulator
MKGKKILIIEDDPKSLYALKSVLEARGFDVAAVSTAEEAATISCDGFAAAVIDIRLPTQQGTDFARDLRTRHPHMRIIFVTAFHDDDALHATLPGSILLIKPIEMDVLCQLL